MVWSIWKRRATSWVPLVLAEGVGGRIAVRRTSERVEMMLDSVTVPTDGHITVAVIPAGYVPAVLPTGMNQRNGLVATQAGSVRIASAHAGGMRILSAQAGQAYSGHITWTTDEQMPIGGA